MRKKRKNLKKLEEEEETAPSRLIPKLIWSFRLVSTLNEKEGRCQLL